MDISGWPPPQAWQSAAVALAIGLLIGSERERSAATAATARDRDRDPGPAPVDHDVPVLGGPVPAGVRTFGLAALAGCVAALIAPVVFAATVLGAVALIGVGYARSAFRDPGATTEIALLVTTLLGGLTVEQPALAAAAGVATAVVLLSKDRLHRFVRQHVSDVELADALKFFVAAFIILPLVPHARLGPYGVIDPRTIWTLVVAVTALGWLGYVAVRMLGARRGLPVAGLAGGFVSGAATTGAMARVARNPGLNRPALAGALLASVATLLQLVAVTAVADRRVAFALAPAAAAGALVLAGEAAWLTLRRPAAAPPPPNGEPEVSGRRPFALIPALLLAAILTAFLILAAFAGDVLGRAGAIVAVAVAGLADAHAGALTAATLAAEQSLTVRTATLAAMAAVGVNTAVKLVLAFVAGGRQVGATLSALFAAPVVVVTLTLALTL